MMDKGSPGIRFKYRGKRYGISFSDLKEWNKFRPIGEPENTVDEIIVKDYKEGPWENTINVNGETIIVGWGPVKHSTIWGGIILLVVVIICIIRHYLKKEIKKDDKKLVERLKNMKTLTQKKLWIRIFFYFSLLLLLLLIPTIYKRFFMTCGIEMLIFLSPFYTFCEAVGISIIIFLAEYYLFAKLKVEIENKELRKGMSLGLILFLIFTSKLSFLLFL
jgi:hypothetical protein